MTGSLLGVGAATAVATIFDADTLAAWAWRLPFLGGALLGSAAILVRHNLHNSERFAAHHAARDTTSPLVQAFTTNRRETLLAVVFASAYGACFYLTFVYLPEWLSGQELMSRSSALAINTAMTVLVIPAMPLLAVVGDRFVPRRTWIALAVGALAFAGWPLYAWMSASDGSTASVVTAHAITFALLAVPLGSGPALFVEMFPESDRLSGYSVAFNLGLGVVGGLTPMIATSLIATTDVVTAPALYMAFAGIAAVLALAFVPDRSRSPLRCTRSCPAGDGGGRVRPVKLGSWVTGARRDTFEPSTVPANRHRTCRGGHRPSRAGRHGRRASVEVPQGRLDRAAGGEQEAVVGHRERARHVGESDRLGPPATFGMTDGERSDEDVTGAGLVACVDRQGRHLFDAALVGEHGSGGARLDHDGPRPGAPELGRGDRRPDLGAVHPADERCGLGPVGCDHLGGPERRGIHPLRWCRVEEQLDRRRCRKVCQRQQDG
jgi:hypothetical protein